MKNFNKVSHKNVFLLGFIVVVAALAALRWACPSVAGRLYYGETDWETIADSLRRSRQPADVMPAMQRVDTTVGGRAHRLVGVQDCEEYFADLQPVQLQSAERLGVKPVQNREAAEHSKGKLIYIGGNPYFDLRDLTMSVPYLVPEAALLLQDIGRNFMDSLYVKNLPPLKPYVTSVLRTQDDVAKLLRYNKNATQKSCHLYGTTFDISYQRFSRNGEVSWDGRGKTVLAEVLRDLKESGRCWVKYEFHQPVFHITVR